MEMHKDVNLEELERVSLHEEFLIERIDPEFGLLDKLLASEGLTRSEVNVIKAKETLEKKNSELLQIIAAKKTHSKFINALRQGRQTHLVNYLLSNGEHRPEFLGDWPLTDREIRILDRNQDYLVDQIDPVELTAHLSACEVLSARQRDAISSKGTDYEKTELLLEILRRKSLNDYKKVIECLSKTNQDHVADILIKGGAVIPIHASVEEDPSVGSDQTETELVTAITNLLGSKSLPECNRILELVPLRLIGIRIGQSVVLYFYCDTSMEQVQLHRMLNEGELKTYLENLFNATLSYKRKTKTSKINVYALHYDENFQSEKHGSQDFKPDEKDSMLMPNAITETPKDVSAAKLSNLPLEILDGVLKKTCLYLILNKTSTENFMESEKFLLLLMSVDFCWFQRFKRKRFKASIMQHLASFYRRFAQKMAIIRNNRRYLVDHLQVKGLPNKLHSAACLTDLQRALINNRNRSYDKNVELFEILKRKIKSQYSAFVDCFRGNSQRISARILENGGVVETLQLKFRGSTSSNWIEKDLVQKLNNLQNKKIPWDRETEIQQNRLKTMDLEILNSYHDNGVAVCIHCKSQSAVNALNCLTPSNDALSALTKLITSLSGFKALSMSNVVVSTEVENEKDVVCCPPNVELFGNIKVSAKFVKGIAKLQDKLYLVFDFPKSLGIYLNQSPFPCQKVMKIDSIDGPGPAAACETVGCLYILDEIKHCIWKMTDDTSLNLWLSIDDFVPCFTVCKDGNVAILRPTEWNSSPYLEIYDREATLKQKTLLPIEIVDAYDIIETSTGNFIVGHKFRLASAIELKAGIKYSTSGCAMSEVTPEGVIVRRLKPSGESQMIHFPQELCLDTDDRVLVSDAYEHRVVIYDQDMTTSQILIADIDQPSSSLPFKIYFDKRARQIILGLIEKSMRFYQLNYF